MASATTYLHNFCFPVAPIKGQAIACRVRQKSKWFSWRKKGCDFSSTGLTLTLQTTWYSQPQLIKICCQKFYIKRIFKVFKNTNHLRCVIRSNTLFDISKCLIQEIRGSKFFFTIISKQLWITPLLISMVQNPLIQSLRRLKQ